QSEQLLIDYDNYKHNVKIDNQINKFQEDLDQIDISENREYELYDRTNKNIKLLKADIVKLEHTIKQLEDNISSCSCELERWNNIRSERKNQKKNIKAVERLQKDLDKLQNEYIKVQNSLC